MLQDNSTSSSKNVYFGCTQQSKSMSKCHDGDSFYIHSWSNIIHEPIELN